MAQPAPGLTEPGGEEERDLRAAAWLDQARADSTTFDDDERRDLLDAEPLEQIRAFLLDDVLDHERLMVPPALEDLGEKAVHALAASRAI